MLGRGVLSRRCVLVNADVACSIFCSDGSMPITEEMWDKAEVKRLMAPFPQFQTISVDWGRGFMCLSRVWIEVVRRKGSGLGNGELLWERASSISSPSFVDGGKMRGVGGWWRTGCCMCKIWYPVRMLEVVGRMTL